MIEDNYNFPADIETRIIVVAKFWRGDSKAGESDIPGNVHIFTIAPENFRELPLRVRRAAVEGNEVLRAVRAIFNQRNGLKIASVRCGLEPGFREFRGDPLDCRIVAGLQGHAALQSVRGDESKVSAKSFFADGREAMSKARVNGIEVLGERRVAAKGQSQEGN